VKRARVLVLGIGNELLSDEGVGIHALRSFAARHALPEDVEVVDGGTTGMELLPQLEGVELLVVVDAVRAGQPPASIVRLDGDRVPAYFKTKLSPHQVGLSDLLAALAFKGTAPKRVVLIGVQPVSLSVGLELSPEVEARLDEVVGLIVSELAGGHPVRTQD
jgi:hydrogenase maturation protease